MAVGKGHEAVVRTLLKHGALPSESNALVFALQENRLDFLTLLLENGADANKGVPLKKAIAVRSAPACVMLIRAEASIGRFIADLIRVAVEGESLELLELLRSRQVDLLSGREEHLAKAVGSGSLQVAKFLLELSTAAAPANADDLLKAACSRGDLLMLELLCSMPAISPRPFFSDLLVISVKAGHLEILKSLQSLGADIHFGDFSLLRLAAEEGQVEVVQCLIDGGAEAHAGDGVALKKSSQAGHHAVVKLLLEIPVDPKIAQDALALARQCNHQSVMALFRAKGIMLKEKERERDSTREDRKSAGLFTFAWFASFGSQQSSSQWGSSSLSPDELRQAKMQQAVVQQEQQRERDQEVQRQHQRDGHHHHQQQQQQQQQFRPTEESYLKIL